MKNDSPGGKTPMKTFLKIAPTYIGLKKRLGFSTKEVRNGLIRHIELMQIGHFYRPD
jgi:hypothetical protein